MTRRWWVFVALFAIALGLPREAQAFHAPPWDTGHQSFQPDNGDNDTDPGDNDCNNSGSPFEVATGNFVHRVSDLAHATLGPSLNVTRTYNSRDMRSGPFGHGWTFGYDQRLIEVTDGIMDRAICRDGNGKREVFLRAPNGTYSSSSDVFAVLVRDQTGGFALTEKTGTSRRFNSDGRLTAVVDRNGNALTFTYDESGFLTAMQSAGGQTIMFQKGANGKVASVSDSLGRTVQYLYDASGNLVRTSDPLQQNTQYIYDAEHNLIRVVDPNGANAYLVGYDALGRVTSYTEDQRAWTVTYQTGQTLKRNALNQTWTLAYNQNGNVTRILSPNGADERFTYDASFNVIARQDQDGNVTQYAYDAQGNITSTTDALGNVTTVTYEPGFNQVATVTDPGGHVTRFHYDARGNLDVLTDAQGNTTVMTYDARGLMTRITDPLSQATILEYNSQGLLTATTDPLGNVTRSTFDAAGRLTSTVDAEGRTTRYAYDAAGRMTSQTDALGQITQLEYDNAGNLIAVVDPLGQRTTHTYNALNQRVSTTDPLGRTESFRYDTLSRLNGITTRAGQNITLTYDFADRQTGRSSLENGITYSYDRRGNLTQVVDSDSSLSFSYDGLNRMTQARTNAGVALPSSTVSHTYDVDSNLTSTTATFGGTTTYAYDELHRPVRLTEPAGSVTSYDYDANSRRTRVGKSNGFVATSQFDAANRLVRLTHADTGRELLRFEYGYDRVGNRTAIQDFRGSHTYVYDALSRLTNAAHSQAPFAEHYAYDAVGNRLASHLSAASRYDAANRLIEDDRFTYLHDLNGNRTQRRDKASGATMQVTFDSANAVTGWTGPGAAATYRYDGLGRRIEKNVNGVITRYLYDGADIVAELNGSNAVVATFTHAPGMDDPEVMRRGSTVTLYHQDGLGSIAGLTNASGGDVGTLAYDSFGQPLGAAPGISNPYGYTAREIDPDSRLLFYRARYYDPETGRFLSEDPVTFAQGSDINRYAYARNNPLNIVDPTGELAWFLAPIIGGLVGGGIDLAWQLIQNGGNFKCVDWGDVAVSAGMGAAFSMLGPSGPIFGRAGSQAARMGYRGGFMNTGNFRVGWSWHNGRNWFGAHGGVPRTPGHWHRTPIPGPSGHGVGAFGLGGGVAGGATGAAIGGGANCNCQ